MEPETLFELIFLRVSKWGEVSKLINFGMDPLWRVNPRGAFNLHHHLESTKYWKYKFEQYAMVAAVDGEWCLNDYRQVLSGMGGNIKDRNGRLLYVSSGKSKAINSKESEIEAIAHVADLMLSEKFQSKNIAVC